MKNEWIKVTERLPENGQRVIVYANGMSILNFGIDEEGCGIECEFYIAEFSEYWDKIIYEKQTVTHWQHLPTPPKE